MHRGGPRESPTKPARGIRSGPVLSPAMQHSQPRSRSRRIGPRPATIMLWCDLAIGSAPTAATSNVIDRPWCLQGTDEHSTQECGHRAPAPTPAASWRYTGRHAIYLGEHHRRGPTPLQRYITLVDGAWELLNFPAPWAPGMALRCCRGEWPRHQAHLSRLLVQGGFLGLLAGPLPAQNLVPGLGSGWGCRLGHDSVSNWVWALLLGAGAVAWPVLRLGGEGPGLASASGPLLVVCCWPLPPG